MGYVAARGTVSRRFRRAGWLVLMALAPMACMSPAYFDKANDDPADGSAAFNPVVYAVHPEFADDPPECIAILPFATVDDAVAVKALARGPASVLGPGDADKPAGDRSLPATGAGDFDPAERVRRAFYAELAPRDRRDVELARVDRMIGKLSADARDEPARIGKRLNCDALMLGRVTAYRAEFFGIYSLVAVGAEVRIVRARDGALLWEGDHLAQSHGGSVPFTPFGIAMALLAAVSNLEDEQIERVTGDLARRLVKTIPDDRTGGEFGTRRRRGWQIVAVGVLNFRAGPGTEFPIQGKLLRHDRVEVIGAADGGGWLAVKSAAGRAGFVATRYLTDRLPEPPPAAAPDRVEEPRRPEWPPDSL